MARGGLNGATKVRYFAPFSEPESARRRRASRGFRGSRFGSESFKPRFLAIAVAVSPAATTCVSYARLGPFRGGRLNRCRRAPFFLSRRWGSHQARGSASSLRGRGQSQRRRGHQGSFAASSVEQLRLKAGVGCCLGGHQPRPRRIMTQGLSGLLNITSCDGPRDSRGGSCTSAAVRAQCSQAEYFRLVQSRLG